MRLTSSEWRRLTKRVNHGWGTDDPAPEKTAAYYSSPAVPPTSGWALAKRAREQAGASPSPRFTNAPRRSAT